MKEKTKEVDELVITVDGVEDEVEKVIEQTLKEIQQRIGATKLFKEYAKRLAAEAGNVATIAKELGPDDPQVGPLKGKVQGIQHAMNVVKEFVESNDREKLRADGRVTAFREVKKNIEAKRQAAKDNAERLKERGGDDGFREDGAPERIGEGRGRKKAGKKKKPAKKKAARKKSTGRKK